jgi:nitronate monooxygenase
MMRLKQQHQITSLSKDGIKGGAMFETRITKMLDIKYPIIQGGMIWLSRAELAAAVSNAGGLGILSSISFPTAWELREEIRKTKGLTDKPFGVNFPIFPATRPIEGIEKYIDAAIEEGVRIAETSGQSPEPYMKQFSPCSKICSNCGENRGRRRGYIWV